MTPELAKAHALARSIIRMWPPSTGDDRYIPANAAKHARCVADLRAVNARIRLLRADG